MSVMWGAGCWRPSAELRRRLQALENRHLRRVLGWRKPPEEEWPVFLRARNQAETAIRERSGCPPLFANFGRTVHRWMGHAARSTLPFLSVVLRYRDTLDWQSRQAAAAIVGASAAGAWRHPRRGWKRDTDSSLSTCLGLSWKQLALQREAWRASEATWMAWLQQAFGGPERQRAARRPSPAPVEPAGRRVRARREE